ncbi:hypothetical protein GCM10009714_12100 [Microlunatus capsulatus]
MLKGATKSANEDDHRLFLAALSRGTSTEAELQDRRQIVSNLATLKWRTSARPVEDAFPNSECPAQPACWDVESTLDRLRLAEREFTKGAAAQAYLRGAQVNLAAAWRDRDSWGVERRSLDMTRTMFGLALHEIVVHWSPRNHQSGALVAGAVLGGLSATWPLGSASVGVQPPATYMVVESRPIEGDALALVRDPGGLLG